jgi:hypothetical protein
MRTVWFSSAVLAVAVLFAVGCEEDDPSDTMMGQNPSQAGQDGGTLPLFDAALPGVDSGSIINNPVGGGDAAQVGPGGPDATVGSDASVPDAGAQPDGAAPSEAGAGGWSPCPGGGMPCKILPLGDSITDGIGFSGGYRVQLFRTATMNMKNITYVGSKMNGPQMVDGMPFPRRHEGTSGITIGGLDMRIPMPGLNEIPHIVLLHIGTNDMYMSPSGAPERLGTLIDGIVMAAPDALIVVSTIIPLSFGGSAVDTYNDAIPAVVQKRIDAGKHILLIDQFTGFPTSELGDGVHPNQAGYSRMAGKWYEAISQYLN